MARSAIRLQAIIFVAMLPGALLFRNALAGEVPGVVQSEFIFDKDAPTKSCHASTLAQTKDGLAAAWFGGTAEGNKDVGIWLSLEADGKWSAPVEVATGVQPDGSRLPCWNPVLLQIPAGPVQGGVEGPLQLFYKVGPNPRTWWGMVVESEDGGKSWSPPRRLPAGILGPIKDKPVLLAGGTLLCPSSTEDTGWRVHMERTSDNGKTWSKTEPLNDPKTFGLIQPTILDHGSAGIQVLCRSQQKWIAESWSHDGGKTWESFATTTLPNPNSGIDAVVMKDGRSLLVYNHTASGRYPLNIAVSNEGKAWKSGPVLETEPGEYSYPAVIQTSDGLVHISYTWKRQRIKHIVVDPAKLELKDLPVRPAAGDVNQSAVTRPADTQPTVPASPVETRSGAGFTDVTRESGLDAVIDAHYQHEPKWWLTGTSLIDLDNDGHLDLILGAHGQTGAVALNDGRGHFRYVEPSASKLPPTEIHTACDIRGNGTVDLQMTHGDGGGQWFRNESALGAPRFEPTPFMSDQGRENAMIDIDRDGNLDWVHEDAGKAAVVFELGDGKGGFRRGGGFPTFKEASAIPVDLDGDGNIDFVIKQCGYHDEHTGHSSVMMNDGHGHFTDRTSECGLVENGVVIQGVGDVNQDGAVDLICLEHGNVEIYLNDGKAHFKKLEGAVTGMERAQKPSYVNWGLAVVTDLDNDGIPDVLVNGRNFLYVLRGTGGGHFVYVNKAWGVTDFAWSAVDEGLCFGDIDGDGRLDLVVSSGTERQKRMSLLHNDLPPRHWINVRPIGAAGNRPAAGAKIRLLEPGSGKLLWYEQVVIAGRQTAHTCYAYGTTERHFGLGDHDTVDVRVEFYPSGKVVNQSAVKADQTVQVRE